MVSKSFGIIILKYWRRSELYIFKIYYKILNGDNLSNHILIITAPDHDSALSTFYYRIKSNLHDGDKVFGSPCVEMVDNNTCCIYSSYI